MKRDNVKIYETWAEKVYMYGSETCVTTNLQERGVQTQEIKFLIKWPIEGTWQEMKRSEKGIEENRPPLRARKYKAIEKRSTGIVTNEVRDRSDVCYLLFVYRYQY